MVYIHNVVQIYSAQKKKKKKTKFCHLQQYEWIWRALHYVKTCYEKHIMPSLNVMPSLKRSHWTFSPENGNLCSHKNLYTNIHSSFIQNSP